MIMSMKVKEIMENIRYLSWSIPKELRGREVFSLCHDSRRATPNCVFFCKAGAVTDGHRYAMNAYMNGARLFVVERKIELPEDAGYILVENSTEELNRLAVLFYREPAKDMRLIGITGTKGKTTVALSVYSVSRALGMQIGYIGTNGVYYGDHMLETANTTPDCPELQRILRDMRDEGINTVILEVSSQALWQDRIYGLQFEICAFTNLYEDHIGGVEHPTMEHYAECKRRLFRDYGAKSVVVNADSPMADYMLEGGDFERVIKISAVGRENCDLFARNIRRAKIGVRPGISFDCCAGNDSSFPFEDVCTEAFIPLPGVYSVENGLLTYGICMLWGFDSANVTRKIAELRVPGRFETVTLSSRPDSLFVIDYAHNGASLSAVLNALREYEPRRIICLFGSVGGRTFGRRAELGRAARQGADVVIVTSDNPDNEEPMHVIEEIAEALEGWDKPYFLIPDRREAVERAFDLAEAGDFILLAGKGHERYQLIRGERVPFSEREILERADALDAVFH